MNDKTTHWYDIDGAIGQAAPEDECTTFTVTYSLGEWSGGTDDGGIRIAPNGDLILGPVPQCDDLPFPVLPQNESADWHALYTADAPKDDPIKSAIEDGRVYFSDDSGLWFTGSDEPRWDRIAPPHYKYDPDALQRVSEGPYRAMMEWMDKDAPKDLKPAPTGIRTAIDSAEEVYSTPRMGGNHD